MKLKKAIKDYMKKYNLKQMEFASEMGISQQSVSKYLRGIGTPTFQTLKKLRKKSKGEIDLIG